MGSSFDMDFYVSDLGVTHIGPILVCLVVCDSMVNYRHAKVVGFAQAAALQRVAFIRHVIAQANDV